jgi:hypothetical protein
LDAFGLGTGFGTQIERALSNAFDIGEINAPNAPNPPTPIVMIRDEEKRSDKVTQTGLHNSDVITRVQRDPGFEWEEDAVLVTVRYYVKSLVFTVPITSSAKTEIIPMCKTLGSACSVVRDEKSWIVNNSGIETRYDVDSEIGYFRHVCDMYETFDEHMMSEAIGRCIVAVAHFEFIAVTCRQCSIVM